MNLFTRIWDWLTYRPWTDAEIAERVAQSVANTNYTCWHKEGLSGPPITGELTHSFTPLSAEEIALQKPSPARPTKRFIYGDHWNAYQKLEET